MVMPALVPALAAFFVLPRRRVSSAVPEDLLSPNMKGRRRSLSDMTGIKGAGMLDAIVRECVMNP